MLDPLEPRCPRCGAATGTTRFCPSCGASLEAFVPGQILDDKYEILDKIGSGGMGEVYRARHLHLDEIRIIKVTRPEASGAADSRRFQEEARLAALVRHPNVAALHDFSRRADGTFYMVWEYIDGVTLQRRLRGGPLSLDQTIEVALQVLSGLEAIHEQGIVHRDLSPDNIMIRETSGGRLQAKIIDLGIAKRLAAESLQMTGTGIFLGKLKYGSPEQAGALKAGQTIDGRSDIYSFGVVFYEMLTGKAPFEAETPQEYLGKHLHQPPPPLDLARLPATAGPAVAAVVRRALAKDRERRFQSARELADAIRAVAARPVASHSQADDETTAIGTRPPVPARRPSRRSWWVLGLLLAASAGALLIARRKAPMFAVGDSSASVVPSPEPSPQSSVALVATTPVTTSSATIEAAARQSSIATVAPAIRHRPTRAPDDSPTLQPSAMPTPAPSGEPLTTPRPRLERWKSRPIEQRARSAQQLAEWANQVVSKRPGAPEMVSFRNDVAALLRSESIRALEQHRPRLAELFYKAYLGLDFAPTDPDLARRMNRQFDRRGESAPD